MSPIWRKTKKPTGNQTGVRANRVESLNKKKEGEKKPKNILIAKPYRFTSTAAQKNPDKIPGCRICKRNS